MTLKITEPQSEGTTGLAKRDFSHAWRALRHRNFRLFFGGQTISLTGTWMTQVATAWLVYRLTKSAIMLGTVGFAGQIPSFLLAPLTGVIVDRFDRRTLMIWTQAFAMLQSLLLAVLTLTHRITIPEILALSVMQGIINSLDMPTRQSMMVKMVDDKTDLSNAIAINASMVHTSRLIGPSLAGLLIAVSNEGWCFAIDSASYIAVILSLLLMRIPADSQARATASMITQMREGWTYVANFAPLRVILMLFAMVSLLCWPFMVLMPIFAVQVLHGGPHTLGFLTGAVGVGALICSLSMMLRRSVLGLTGMIPIGTAAFGVGLILFGLSRSLWFSIPIMFVIGFGMIQELTASNTLLQTLVDEKMRGRVMSYYTLAFGGMAPFGSLFLGVMAHAIGAPHTVILSGIACILGALWFCSQLKTIRAEMRPIYQQMGILPQPSIVDEPPAVGPTARSV
jgi:MFS family permease